MAHRSVTPALLAALIGIAFALQTGASAQSFGQRHAVPLKEAKLNIEHNATDHDTGFQGAIDSEGWKELKVRGPDGVVLEFEAEGKMRSLGLTELFFETVEPENAEVPIPQMLAKLPAGNYRIYGPIAGSDPGFTVGTAWLTHVIPAGPVLLSPAEGATVWAGELLMKWRAVTKTIYGGPVKIIAYQLIVEKVADPHPHMIGKPGSLSMYLPPSTTQIAIPRGFLQRSSPYAWEVLAIEESGNQTLSSGEFQTR
jgi:hypothetical protein